MYRCPLCTQPLSSDSHAFRCLSGHSFDKARQGYVNLVVGGSRRSSGDDPEAVRARRLVLDAGHFDALRSRVLDHVLAGPLLDVGCGEGFYSRPLERANYWVGGIDLSKTGVRLAAGRSKGIDYAVANAFRMPIGDSSLSTILSVFAPIAAIEFRRVLRQHGRAIVVGPGPLHLAQLKEVVFPDATPHTGRGPSGVGDLLERVEMSRLTYDVQIEQPHLDALLAMTPYRWQADPPSAQRLAAIRALTVTLDFTIAVLQPA